MPTLAALLAATDALAPVRRARSQKARIAAAVRLAPADPTLALNAYRSRANEYLARVDVLLDRYADDPQGFSDALASVSMRGAARRAAKLAQTHARRELRRALGVPVPVSKEGDMAVQDAFVAEQERLWAKLAADVARTLATDGPEAARNQARWRARLISSDQVFKVRAEATSYYAQQADSQQYVWVTQGDERVRPGHSRLHMTVQRWESPPNTGRKEGNNHPGQAIHCRCRAAPLPTR